MTSDDSASIAQRPYRPDGLPAYIASAAVIGWITILVLFATWAIGGWIGALGDRLASMEGRETNVGAMLAAMDAKIDRRSEAIEARVSETNSRIDRVIERMDGVLDRTTQLQAGITQLRADVERVNERMDQILQRLEAAGERSPAGFEGEEREEGVRRADFRF